MAKTSQGAGRAAPLAGAVAVLALLTACGSGDDTAGGPRTVSGTATTASASPSPSPSGTGTTAGTATPSARPSDSATPASPETTDAPVVSGSRCHTSELSASVGRNNPGAGQENFPIVLTNRSGRTCTVRGYPGAAFLDASGKQLGPDPQRSSGPPVTVRLAPGRSAWAGLSFANPEVSGAHAASPASLLVTPPDERDPLKVTWKGGEVPVSGNESAVKLIPFSPGTGS
ncbi:hypothetical protein M2271_000115 [Streptomyces sp. LBL]|uniref:DUF4232 domain-containing protein n=1 Tax=Streptomyces sp. LBL TaxID=2940562 RepID=UPI0024731841|nr:DUF4232 domain-containing protein [Streptomyces sp. LBL]MDH6622328.1 hypothetical protein [Streptomyces sp. LBL]